MKEDATLRRFLLGVFLIATLGAAGQESGYSGKKAQPTPSPSYTSPNDPNDRSPHWRAKVVKNLDGAVLLTGSAEVSTPEVIIRADRILFSLGSGQAEAEGNVRVTLVKKGAAQ